MKRNIKTDSYEDIEILYVAGTEIETRGLRRLEGKIKTEYMEEKGNMTRMCMYCI